MESLFTAITTVGGTVLCVLAVLVSRSRHTRGAKEISAALLAMCVWVWGAALEPHVGDLSHYLWVVNAKYTAIALTPAFTALGITAYSRQMRISARVWAAALALPAITISLIWTNEAHELMWAHPPLGPNGERTALLPWGVWFWSAHLPSSYVLAAICVAQLARELWRPTYFDRARIALLMVGVLLPLVANALYTAGLVPWKTGPTPIAITVSGLLFAWGFFSRGLFRLAPVAYQAVFAQMRDGVLVTDAEGHIQLANPAASAIGGRSEADLLDAHVLSALPPDGRLRALADASVSSALSYANGADQHIEIAMSPIRDERGALAGRVFLLRDVTEREGALAALRESEMLVRGIVEHSPNGVLRLRPRRGHEGEVRDFVCAFANASAAAQLGRPVAELVGRPFKGAVHPHTAALFQTFREVLRSGTRAEIERALQRDDGETWIRFLAVPAGDDVVVTCIDVTNEKRRERAMQAAACEDSLTGLLNRRGFEADAPSVLSGSLGENRPCALLYLDLDRFKEVNDACGHELGDLVLCEFAARLQRCTRGPDLLARLGGDEFAVLLPDADLEIARYVARRVLEASREPIRAEQHVLRCTPSIGIALHPAHGSDLRALVQAADAAMYEAKAAQRGVAIADTARVA